MSGQTRPSPDLSAAPRCRSGLDCGVAALLGVLRFWGGDAPLLRIARLCAIDEPGTSPQQLVHGARKLGFQAAHVAATLDDLANHVPCIVSLQRTASREHFVIVYRVTYDCVVIDDPTIGIRRLDTERFRALWNTRTAILLEPGERLVPVRPSPPGMHTGATGPGGASRHEVFE